MTDRSDIPSFDQLLCERCGYVVEGLDASVVCPECGYAIQESLPRLREGTAYQIRRSWYSLVRTWAATLLRSKRTFERLRVDKQSGRSLMWRGMLLAMSLPVSFMVAVAIVMTVREYELMGLGMSLVPFLAIGIYWVVIMAVGVSYTALAMLRVKYVAKRRGMRMSSDIAWTVAGQASMGLTLWPVTFAIWVLLAAPVMVYAEWSGDYGVYSEGWYRVLQTLFSVFLYVSFVLSFVEFEVLLSMGTRRLRYRNPVKEEVGAFWDRDQGAGDRDPGMRMDIS